MINYILRILLPKTHIQRVEVNGCMADHKKIVETGLIIKKINKTIYGSNKPTSFYLCKFPSGYKQLSVSRCRKDKNTGIVSYSI